MPGSHAYTTGWVADECIRLLTNMAVMPQFFDTSYEPEFNGKKAFGDTFNVKYADRGVTRNQLEYVGDVADRRTTQIVADKIVGADFEYDTIEKMFQMEKSETEISEQIIKPRIQQIKTDIDLILSRYVADYATGVIGNLGGTNPTALTTYNGARTRIAEQSLLAPGKRGMLITPDAMGSSGVAALPYQGPMDEVSRMFREGFINRYAGFDWIESMDLKLHTAGTWAGTVETSSAGQSGNTLALTATTGDTVKRGDKFTLENVYAVNVMTRQSTRRLKVFTALNDATAASSAFASGAFTFYPAIEGPGSKYQNVDALPANGADLVLWPGTTSPNGKIGPVGLAMTKDFGFLVGVDLPMPKPGSVEVSWTRTDPETGLSLSMVRTFENRPRKWITRIDCAFGLGVKYSDAAVAVALGN
jgi:hypothetical protein